MNKKKRNSVRRKSNLRLARERQQRHMVRTGATELVLKSFTLKRRPSPEPKAPKHSVQEKKLLCEACGHPGFVSECVKCGFEGDGGAHEAEAAWPPDLDALIDGAQETRRAAKAAKRKKAARFRRNKRRATRRTAPRTAKTAGTASQN